MEQDLEQLKDSDVESVAQILNRFFFVGKVFPCFSH